jgi:uncharacterized membrane protein
MTTIIIRYINLIIAGLFAGILLGICLGYNPKNLSAATFIEQQQNVIKALNTLMPLLGLITIILTLLSAFLQKDNKTVFITLLMAALLLIISGIITRTGNQPINKIIMTWNKADIPANWTELRDKWWSFHIIRTVTTVVAFCLIVATAIRKV